MHFIPVEREEEASQMRPGRHLGVPASSPGCSSEIKGMHFIPVEREEEASQMRPGRHLGVPALQL